jgi:microsomal dipeptidase-like Zn-dependent dipeptidase
MDQIFDFHFHLLFKHEIASKKNGGKYSLSEQVTTTGVAKILNSLIGGSFDSQSSPSQMKDSPISLGVTALIAVEHAFAERILHVMNIDLSHLLPLDWTLFDKIRTSKISYWDQFKDQVKFYVDNKEDLSTVFNIEYLKRSDFEGKEISAIETALLNTDKKRFALSIEGGHNLSNVPIRNADAQASDHPEERLREIQEMLDVDFMSINLCHLSYIPEQPLGGFAQGLNGLAMIAFDSDDFLPKNGLGITDLGISIIHQALTHPTKPIVIDVKHMSLYSRFQYYRLKEKLSIEDPDVDRLPIISSHSGFTFTTAENYINNKLFRSFTSAEGSVTMKAQVEPLNRKIGRTNDMINKGLYCNPWTINLFDEDISQIMQSRGMIGISIDQRILGASNPAVDSVRDRYFQKEYVAYPEWKELFEKGFTPITEGLLKDIAPSSSERHIMLLCLHMVYAVRVGLASLTWLEDTSPWDHICLGTDFDGLINPINGFENCTKLDRMKGQLMKYLPMADKYLLFYEDLKALNYDLHDRVIVKDLNEVVDKFLFKNGLRFMARYLSNWKLGVPEIDALHEEEIV